jgi:ubiquinone/menaquinone biosynthesis C-methylase UbiE
MAALHTQWTALLDRQHRLPTGLVGRLVGQRMLRQHAPETLWTIDRLDIQPTDHVLELGFGAGRGLELARRRADRGNVTGLDLSATMICAAARRNQTAIKTRRLALLRGDLAMLPFAGRRFDKIYSIHTFYFWPQPLPVFGELLRILKPGGALMITLSTGRTTPAGERVYSPLQATLETQIVPALQQQGHQHVAIEYGPDSRHYNNVAVVVQSLDKVLAPLQSQTEFAGFTGLERAITYPVNPSNPVDCKAR